MKGKIMAHAYTPKPVVRTWRVQYMESGYHYSVFYRWFLDELHARRFAKSHDMPGFHPVVTHVPYGG